MELRQFLDILWRRKWVIALTVVLALLVASLGSYLMKPVYSASSMVRITESSGAPIGYAELNYAGRLMNTYVELLRSRPFMQQAIQQLGLSADPKQLAKSVKVEALPNTELIRITAESTSPAQAADIANTLAGLLVQEWQTVQSKDADGVSIVETAIQSQVPVRPRPELYIPVGALLGLIGGVGLAFLFANVDQTIRSEDDLEEAAKLPSLGSIPRLKPRKKAGKGPFLLGTGEWSPAIESFRLLAANAISLLRASGSPTHSHGRVLLVTSAEPMVGRSTVVANLAAAMGRAGHRVVVVDLDPVQPVLHRVFTLSDRPGMPSALANPKQPELALQKTDIPGVSVLGGDRQPDGLVEPLAMLSAGDQVKGFLVTRLAEDADVVLLDSPAVLTSAEASILAPLSDGVLIVAARNRSNVKGVTQATARLELVGGNLLGVVLNMAGRGPEKGVYPRRKEQKQPSQTAAIAHLPSARAIGQ